MNEKLSLSGLNRIGVEEFKQKEKNPIVIVLDNIRSMNNVGSVFRTSDAFLIEKIFLCGIFPKQEKVAIVFGNEVEGVDQEIINISDGVIEIPQFGTKHSLNISVSAGIVIWDLFNKLQ